MYIIHIYQYIHTDRTIVMICTVISDIGTSILEILVVEWMVISSYVLLLHIRGSTYVYSGVYYYIIIIIIIVTTYPHLFAIC